MHVRLSHPAAVCRCGGFAAVSPTCIKYEWIALRACAVAGRPAVAGQLIHAYVQSVTFLLFHVLLTYTYVFQDFSELSMVC